MPFRSQAKALAQLVIAVLAIYALIGIGVDTAIPYISVEREVAWLGKSSQHDAPEFATSFPTVPALFRRLVDASPLRGVPLSLELLDDQDENALAAPGGRVLLFRGLLEHAQSENEVAMVLGHEIGHIVQRDALRGVGRALFIVLFRQLISGGAGAEELGLVGGLVDVTSLAYSRHQESDADAIGIRLVNAVYGHVGGATGFFERLQRYDPALKLVGLLRSHPLSADRITRLQELSRELGFQAGAVTRLVRAGG